MEAGNLTQATDLWGVVEERIGNLTEEVDWYNVLQHNIPGTGSQSAWMLESIPEGGERSHGLISGQRHLGKYHKDPLTKFMREDVTPALGIIPDNVTWGSQAAGVFKYLEGDFMTSVVPSVDKILASGLPITIYNGQLDLICSTLGLNAWLPKLQWNGLANFTAAEPKAIYAIEKSRNPTGFFREHENLSLYIILRAGHMIPSDQPVAALDMIKKILEKGLARDVRSFLESKVQT